MYDTKKENPAPEKRAGFPNFERWYWMERAKVYFTPEISPDALQRMYHALERSLTGRVAVKISTGEPGGHNFLQPSLIRGILLHGKIRMIFHKQRLLFVPESTLVLC